MEPGPVEIRVLGCLIEKQRTTPDAYPLSLNALRLACNQATNRDPVTDLGEPEIRHALDRLGHARWTRLTSGRGGHTAKFRHLLDEALGLGAAELALLAVLMLRGPQTPGELKSRVERLHPFADLVELRSTLDRLIERGHVRPLERRPGQKEERYLQLLGGEEAGGAAPPTPAAPARARPAAPVAVDPPARVEAALPGSVAPAPSGDGRVEALERQVAVLGADLTELRAQVEALRRELGG